MGRQNTNQSGWSALADASAAEAAVNGGFTLPRKDDTSHQTHLPGRLLSPPMLRPPPGLSQGVPTDLAASGAHHLHDPFADETQARDPVRLSHDTDAHVQPIGSTFFPRRRAMSNDDTTPKPLMYEEQAAAVDDTTSAAGHRRYTSYPIINENFHGITLLPTVPEGDMGQDDDILSSSFPPPSIGRRGCEHIVEAISKLQIVQQATPPPQNHAVPWGSVRSDPETANIPKANENRFTPMRTVDDRNRRLRLRQHLHLQQPSPPAEPSLLRGLLCELSGFSINYKGDIGNAANRSADIPEDQNCSLWIVGLFAGMTVSRLLDGVTRVGPTGKVYATVISDAQPDKGHTGAAAKIVFFTRQGADRLKAAIDAQRLDGVIGRRVRVSFNRIRSAPQPASDNSRVVIIWGPSGFVDYGRLEALFKERIEYQTESVTWHDEPATGTTILEWRFGSFRAQAQAVCMYLSKEHHQTLKWKYGRDPCEGFYGPGVANGGMLC